MGVEEVAIVMKCVMVEVATAADRLRKQIHHVQETWQKRGRNLERNLRVRVVSFIEKEP